MQIGFSWITSPALTELETVMLDWVGRMMRLPEAFLSGGKGGGVIQGSASEAVLIAVLAARARALSGGGSSGGSSGAGAGASAAPAAGAACDASKLVGYASEHAHSSVSKAFLVAGVPLAQLRLLPTTHSSPSGPFALEAETLARAMAEDRAKGLVPFFVCATLGTTR